MRLVTMFFLALLAAGPAASAIEKPRHTVTETFADFELRQFPSYLVAETRVEGNLGEAGSEGFRRLAGCIFGKNQGGQKMAMPREGLKALGEPIWARDGPPWTPWFLRTNEILVAASVGSPAFAAP